MLTPERTIADALQHALALAYMEQGGMEERLAHETALEVLEKRGVAVGKVALETVNVLRHWGELPERTIYDGHDRGEEPLVERLRHLART